MHTNPSYLRILVVDDCRDTTRSYALLLKTWGHEPLTAHDGPTALELARSERPDVILLDLGLPGQTGWDVAVNSVNCPNWMTCGLSPCPGTPARRTTALTRGGHRFPPEQAGRPRRLTPLAGSPARLRTF